MFWLENLKGNGHFEDLKVGLYRVIILKWILENMGKAVEWIYFGQDRDSWRALVNTVMNFRIP
jgi:hypothetical protein